MKRNKAGLWISLAFTLIALIAGIAFTIVNLSCPVKVGEEITAYYQSGAIMLNGTLVNESDSDVVITYIDITVTTTGDSVEAYSDKEITLAPGEEFDFDGLGVSSYTRPKAVTSVSVTVNGWSYDLQGVPFLALFMYIFAALFAIATIALFVSEKKKSKQSAAFAANMPSFGANAVTFSGVYSKEGETGKAAAKSALSALGGIFAAIFLGFGAYKIYSSGTQVDLVVSDDGLFIINPEQVNTPYGVTSILKGAFPESEITVKKRRLILKNVNTKEYFVFNTTKKGMSPAELEEKLKALIAAEPATPAQSGENSPFTEFESPASEAAAADNGEAQKTEEKEEKADDPFGDL